ncbi:glycosyltransferase [Henriciella mobilis]|uniref:Methyltransferase FkbM domain-containing protein n=1 Tax=Henriciella mobilis TaxID=2305467 RepID=A0A399RRZ2_9PROT|nr:glycosyltransferase [Henriciella mobilis]RIJ32315.1 hypothetical protein D1223_00150 [Henriciella mobilis]
MSNKLVHRIWFGGSPVPEAYERYWNAWRRMMPDTEFVTWDEARLDDLPVTRSRRDDVKSAVQLSDIARYELLASEGGTYLDCDILPLRQMDFSGADRLVTCNENDEDDIRSIGFIAAPAGDASLVSAVEKLKTAPLGATYTNVETGPVFFRSVIQDELRLPRQSFYPYSAVEPLSVVFDRDLSETIGIHVWGMSWLDPGGLAYNALRQFGNGDTVSSRTHALALADRLPFASDLLRAIEETRLARAQLARALRAPVFHLVGYNRTIGGWELTGTDPETLAFPTFLEACWQLLTTTPASKIWQVGAADGILVDPLRPILANFDPSCALLEPNPYLFKRLKENYALNERAQMFELAMGENAGEFTLNAVNPEKVETLDLPAWAVGISSFHLDKNALGGLTITAELQRRIEKAVESVRVQKVSPTQLREACGFWPDILIVDAEGDDAEIINAILAQSVYPKIILFEHACMPQEQRERLQSRLGTAYFSHSSEEDTLALRADFYAELAMQAFVDAGRKQFLDRMGLDVIVR